MGVGGAVLGLHGGWINKIIIGNAEAFIEKRMADVRSALLKCREK